jgi:predicted acylesterase/phospholipase RssA
MRKTTILTVDGGGIKGIIPACILSYIEEIMEKPCYQLFDIIGGTSTGGIITAALTSPVTGNRPMRAKEVEDIYRNHGSDIFVGQGLGYYYAKYYADHHDKGIEPFLRSKLQDTTLSQAAKNMERLGGRTRQVFTTSYTVDSTGGKVDDPKLGTDYGPYLFNWFDACGGSENDYMVWEAARATSAAPTYFPVARVGDGAAGTQPRWVLDGGVMSNNPTVWAVSEAFRTGLAESLHDIAIVSLGTGTYPAGAGLITAHQGGTIPGDGNWGDYPWLMSSLYDLARVENGVGAIIHILTEAVQLVSGQQIRSLRKGGLEYIRLEPRISKKQSIMDNIARENIRSLENTTNRYIVDHAELFQKVREMLSGR